MVDINEENKTALKGVEPVSIVDEMQRSYLDYAMSVIVSRALPDVRDGLKPVHRRILYAAYESGYYWNRKHVKSARPVADVMGKYHPHGDVSIYDALVRMAQKWSMRAPLIDGQGNFGSIDGDPPAAMRYTEARLTRLAHEILEDINSDTVDFQSTYDSSGEEPKVLPARFPNLLVNGSGGIAVGMATNIPPHNLGEVCNAAIALIDDPDMSMDDLISIIPGPDFPTGGIILGRSAIYDAFATGRGSIRIRGKVHIEPIAGDRECIVVTEMPYQVNKSAMIEKIAELVRNKRIEGISDIRDESDRQGYRLVIELKRHVVADVILNQLYAYTSLQTFFGINSVALNGGKPEIMNLIDMLKAFIAFREEVIIRRTKFILRKKRDHAHILLGLSIAVANLDAIVHMIRHAPNPQEARKQLIERYWPAADIVPFIALIDDRRHVVCEDGTCLLSEDQVRAILDLRLHRLTALGREEIDKQLNETAAEIRECLAILSSSVRIKKIVREGLIAVRDEFSSPRLTEIVDFDGTIGDENLIQKEDMVITVTHEGYIKRVPLSLYRSQNRGGKGRSGVAPRDTDFVTRLFVANTHVSILFFSSRGLVYKEKVWRLPLGSHESRGKPLINMLSVESGDHITAIMPLPEDESLWKTLDIMFATTSGRVRRNKLSDFIQVNKSGKIAMKLAQDDSILAVETCQSDDDILLTADSGQCIRFSVSDVRTFKGRDSQGVLGIRLQKKERAISMTVLKKVDVEWAERCAYLKRSFFERRNFDEAQEEKEEIEENKTSIDEDRYNALKLQEQFVLTVSKFGYAKRSSSYDFRLTLRGGKGIRATDIAKKSEIGSLVAAFPVNDDDEIMLVSNKGQVIRIPVGNIRITSRTSKGVIVFNTTNSGEIVSVERIQETHQIDSQEDTSTKSVSVEEVEIG